MTTTLPGKLVETEWVAEHLGDADLRVLECTTILRPGDDGRLRAESGRADAGVAVRPGGRDVGGADLVDAASIQVRCWRRR